MKNYLRIEGSWDGVNWVVISEMIEDTWYDYGFDMSTFRMIRIVKLLPIKEIDVYRF